jgi:hypothetical protein
MILVQLRNTYYQFNLEMHEVKRICGSCTHRMNNEPEDEITINASTNKIHKRVKMAARQVCKLMTWNRAKKEVLKD